ncbi:B12-binding domain-containing radical SAM protein [Bacteroidota bacterium]
MKILLVYPHIPDTFWSFQHALKFISKKASSPPLGLLTIAAMLPSHWEKKVVDLNVKKLQDKDINWADYVLISAMSVQQVSALEVIERCRKLNTKIVAGGPLFTGEPNAFSNVDHLVLNEGELTFPAFMQDLENHCAEKIYQSSNFADLLETPPPDYSLVKVSDYSQISLQYSRGCPFHCDFCEITSLLGRKVRTKSSGQILLELDHILDTGHRGTVFFVDDNFIGNKKKIKEDLLPKIIEWMEEHKHPFCFTTEASINLSDDAGLMDLMARAGFVKVFVGIETPEVPSLLECGKHLNVERNMMECVRDIHNAGIEVSAGFIVGFDNDSPGVFQRQIDFIQQSGIITAMVGLLTAPNHTRLYNRLFKEGRILFRSNGDNTSKTLNFIPKMDKDVILKGYQQIVDTIYSRKAYYKRLKGFLRDYHPLNKLRSKVSLESLLALWRSVIYIGLLSKCRFHYWNLFFWSLFRRPDLFPMAITYSIYGYHFRKVFGVTR